MNRDELVRLATLWFVVMTFLQTGSGESHPVVTVAVFIALILLWMIPFYIVVDLVRGGGEVIGL
ncbi:hypothetical protein AUR64_04605 [Haloprofundus marisrubri]|uniref:Potassium channel domain-containing protein n=1 Tax=Haloprofundus marisrubri TaxID=1514971 RepID=A0A0W1RDM1_9EURY|nr:hypothetical protein [Haloprofundus marisrubri]KTG11213.1 hypothetical protein AUR64_04605 [Haloprofundus marisrubri]